MALTIFLLAAALAVLAIGAGFFWAMFQLAKTLTHVRQTVMPQVELTLTEIQRNLNHIDELTVEVDQTVESANQLVDTAQKTVQTVNTGLDKFNKQVAVPLIIRTASALEGVRVGLKTLRTPRVEPRAQVVLMPEVQAPLVIETFDRP